MSGKRASEMSAAEYFSELEASSLDERLKRSLERIKVACDRIESELKAAARGKTVLVDRPLSIANVGRKCTEMFGGPSADSITNNRVKEPRKALYIELRAAELEAVVSKQRRVDHLASISDPRIRLYVKSLENRNKELLDIIRGYSKRFREAPPATLNEMLDAGTDVLTTPASTPVPLVSKALSDAVHQLTSVEALTLVGLRIENDYVIEPISENELLQPHHVRALRALVNLSTG